MVKDSIEFNEYQVRTYTKGQGPLLLLFHGIGPGTSEIGRASCRERVSSPV